MPLYVYECPICNAQRSDVRTIAERKSGPQCDKCRWPMALVLSATPGIVRDPAVPRKQK
jgi:putative FmdB family regulatory protein